MTLLEVTDKPNEVLGGITKSLCNEGQCIFVLNEGHNESTGFGVLNAGRHSRFIVKYRQIDVIVVGERALIIPTGYPYEFMKGEGLALTDSVLSLDKDSGTFETKQTRYVLDNSYEH